MDFNSIPGLAELSLELSRLMKKTLKNENMTVDEQRENIRYCLEIVSAANNILILKDVKKCLGEDGTFNQNLLFVTDLIVDTDMFNCVTFMTTSRYINVPFSYCEATRQLPICGMDDSHIAEIIQNNLPKTFQSSNDKTGHLHNSEHISVISYCCEGTVLRYLLKDVPDKVTVPFIQR